MKIKLVLILVVMSLILTGCQNLGKEHTEAREIEIKNIDFKNLRDGKYVGSYEGGMYKWRENNVEVTIKDKRVTEIRLIKAAENRNPEEIYRRIIEKQSLDVDGIAGATLTSRSFIKGVERALLNSINQ